MISRAEIIKVYLDIAKSNKKQLDRDCHHCIVGRYKNSEEISRKISEIDFSSNFSSCGKREYIILKRFAPSLTQEKFIKFAGGNSIFCGHHYIGDVKTIAEKIYNLLVPQRSVKI